MADSYHIIDGEVVPYSGGRICIGTDAWRDATQLELQLQEQLEEYEHIIAAQTAEIEALQAEIERLQGALNISPDDVGRIMHESWSRTKRSQGFHHPSECPNGRWVETARGRAPCPKCHTDLIPWDNLPEPQKDINRHAFDDVLAEIRRRADIAERCLAEERDGDD